MLQALLRDTQTQLERQKADNPGKVMIRQLRNQLEDLECARAVAVKARQSLEVDLSETQTSLEEANRTKHDAEQKVTVLSREKTDLQNQLEENEEELAEVLKRYKAAVQQMSLDQIALQEQVSLVSEREVSAAISLRTNWPNARRNWSRSRAWATPPPTCWSRGKPRAVSGADPINTLKIAGPS